MLKGKNSDVVFKIHFLCISPPHLTLLLALSHLCFTKSGSYTSSNDLQGLAPRITQSWKLFLAREHMERKASLDYGKKMS